MRGALARFFGFVLVLVSGSVFLGPTFAADATQVVAVVDGPWERNDAILAIFRTELVGLLGDEFGVTLDDADVRVADWTVAGIRRTLDAAFADPDVDVVIALGVIASGEMVRRTSFPKPAIAPFVIDPEVQGAPLVNGVSGVHNLAYITAVNHSRRDLKTFLELVRFEKLAVLVTSTVMESFPEMPDRMRAIGREQGVDLTIVPVTDSAAAALAALPPDTQAVYVAPLLRLPDSEFDALAAGLIERKLPSFSLLGRLEVERGILAGLTPKEEFERIARRTALNIQRILLGEDASTLPVHFPNVERLSINLATARAIGVRPSWSILT
ncbi:MAG: hypothetical protein KC591_04590, partial [Gemmatimonadetes bacterium]|nr:hypothetical protein [Gemmatimonadota bacterium]